MDHNLFTEGIDLSRDLCDLYRGEFIIWKMSPVGRSCMKVRNTKNGRLKPIRRRCISITRNQGSNEKWGSYSLSSGLTTTISFKLFILTILGIATVTGQHWNCTVFVRNPNSLGFFLIFSTKLILLVRSKRQYQFSSLFQYVN